MEIKKNTFFSFATKMRKTRFCKIVKTAKFSSHSRFEGGGFSLFLFMKLRKKFTGRNIFFSSVCWNLEFRVFQKPRRQTEIMVLAKSPHVAI